MRIKEARSTDTPGGRIDDDETRCAFLLDTDGLSLGDRAAIWRTYLTVVVGLCKDVDDLKERIDSSELGSIVADLIEDEWTASTNWHDWHRDASKDLERQVKANPALREKLDELQTRRQ
jgi:hypothetical protein